MIDELEKTKLYLLEAARLLVPAQRVLVYEVNNYGQPHGHVSSSNKQNWTHLYGQFINLDPYHPRHFSQVSDNVYGTAPGFNIAKENSDYVNGFRSVLGVRYKAEVFLRDPKGVIRAGIRYVRLDDDQEFNSFEMEKLNTMHKLFASMWCNALARHQEELILSDLTYREREMLQLLFLGYPNQDIARLLSIALPTVKSHMKNILTKTGYSNRAELIGALYQTGLPLRC